jgi:RND family efflux transporter MFP subunit
MKTIHALMLLMTGAVLLNACSSNSAASEVPTETAIPVQLQALNAEATAVSIPVSGQFTTDDEVLLSFKTDGIIQRILVKEGDAIRQGQTVAILDPTEIDAQLQQAQLAYEKAQRDYQRTNNLYRDSVYTLEQLQNAKTAMDMAQQQLRSARFNRNHTVITAPRNGYVLRKLANEGQQVKSGTSVIQTNGALSGNWLLRVNVSNKEWAAIHIKDSASVEVESVPGKNFRGVVSRRAEGIDPTSGSFQVDIRLLGEKPEAIAFGMFGKAVVHTGEAATTSDSSNGPWSIPYDALLDGDGSSGYVFISNDKKTARRVKVSIAGMEKDKVIISQGLEGAKDLIISGSAYLTDSSKISVVSH